MENEKKNNPAGEQKQGGSGNHRPKNRHGKHKPYYMTPNSEQAPSGEQKPAQNAQQPQKKADAGAGSNQGRSHKHNNHHKHKKNNNAPKEEQKSQIAQAEPQSKPTEAPAPKPQQDKSAQDNAQRAPSNRNKNKRKRHNDRRREDKQPATDTLSIGNKTADTLTSDIFSPLPRSADRLQRPAPPQKLTKFSDSPEYEKYSDYEEYTFEELYGKDEAPSSPSSQKSEASNNTENTTDGPKVEVVGIRFKTSGKTYYFAPNGITLKLGAKAIVETARGLEYGDVALGNTFVNESETVSPLRPVIRKATDADIKHHEDNKLKEDEAFRICNEKIIAHELDMKLIDAQYTFDNTKLLFYFTSAGRVDFRDLVKDLASVFRTRIELRQIGIRDEAKMVGGLGLCGRPLCCSLFLTDFGQVSIKMAKEQNLSLNSSKISGICGRLMCCLRYEHETYEYEIKRTPPVDSLVRTVDGVGVVTEINPLAATIKVKLVSSPDTPPKTYKRDEVSVLKKKQEKQ